MQWRRHHRKHATNLINDCIPTTTRKQWETRPHASNGKPARWRRWELSFAECPCVSARGGHQHLIIIMIKKRSSPCNATIHSKHDSRGSRQSSHTSARHARRHARTSKKITATLIKQCWVRLREWNIFTAGQETVEIFNFAAEPTPPASQSDHLVGVAQCRVACALISMSQMQLVVFTGWKPLKWCKSFWLMRIYPVAFYSQTDHDLAVQLPSLRSREKMTSLLNASVYIMSLYMLMLLLTGLRHSWAEYLLNPVIFCNFVKL